MRISSRPECAASGSATTSSASSVSALSAATRIARADGCRAGRGFLPAQLRVLTEDRPFELLQRWAGLDAELLDEHLSAVPVCLQRLGLPAGSIEREHQLAAQALAQRVLEEQSLQLAHEVEVPTESEIGVDPALERSEP